MGVYEPSHCICTLFLCYWCWFEDTAIYLSPHMLVYQGSYTWLFYSCLCLSLNHFFSFFQQSLLLLLVCSTACARVQTWSWLYYQKGIYSWIPGPGTGESNHPWSNVGLGTLQSSDRLACQWQLAVMVKQNRCVQRQHTSNTSSWGLEEDLAFVFLLAFWGM